MAGRSPAQTHELWAKHLNEGSLDALLELYDEEIALVPEPGAEPRHGIAATKEVLAGYIATKPTVKFEHTSVIEAGEVALVMTRWSLSGTGPDGTPLNMAATTSDVLRRGADGEWRHLIDNPWGTP